MLMMTTTMEEMEEERKDHHWSNQLETFNYNSIAII